MSTRERILSDFYNQINEDERLAQTKQGRLEYFTTMHYIHRCADKNSKVLEIGAGTGRYSIALAREGMDVTAVELVESNITELREKSRGIKNIQSFQGDATNLECFTDNSFDATLSLGPMYHLYDEVEVNKAIDEAIRVTKPGGAILFAFLSIYAIMYSNYLFGNWAFGQKENFAKGYKARHYKEQLFTGYDIVEFERLFKNKPVKYITTTGVDGPLELAEKLENFSIPDEDFPAFTDWYITFCEKREFLGSATHLLYICRKAY